MKTKKIIKQALKHPELYTPGELDYFRLMKKARKEAKKRKQTRSDEQAA